MMILYDLYRCNQRLIPSLINLLMKICQKTVKKACCDLPPAKVEVFKCFFSCCPKHTDIHFAVTFTHDEEKALSLHMGADRIFLESLQTKKINRLSK